METRKKWLWAAVGGLCALLLAFLGGFLLGSRGGASSIADARRDMLQARADQRTAEDRALGLERGLYELGGRSRLIEDLARRNEDGARRAEARAEEAYRRSGEAVERIGRLADVLGQGARGFGRAEALLDESDELLRAGRKILEGDREGNPAP